MREWQIKAIPPHLSGPFSFPIRHYIPICKRSPKKISGTPCNIPRRPTLPIVSEITSDDAKHGRVATAT
jgi:hypothetical protein